MYKFIIALSLLTNILLAQTNVIDKLIKTSLASKSLQNASWSLCAEYIDNSQPIINYQGQLSLTPASGLKLITTAAALDILGEDYKCYTRIYYDGHISKNGTLEGNIYIQGGGDPTLGSDRIKNSLPLDSLMKTWVESIKKYKITKINGSIIADDLLFDHKRTPDYWNWIDIGNYYGAGPSALSIHDNLYYLLLKTGNVVGQPAIVLGTEPEIPGLTFINKMKTGPRFSGDNGYIYAAPNQFKALLDGTVPAGRKIFKIKGAIPDPALFVAQRLYQELIDHGIPINDYPTKLKKIYDYNNAKLIHTFESPPLKDIIFGVNKRSVNLYAEQLVKLIAVNQNESGSIKNGINEIIAFLEERSVNTEGIDLFDGSGLSRANLITTNTMVELLKLMAKHSSFKIYYNSLAIAGDPNDEGNLNRFGKGTIIANNARIKSGFFSNTRSHSGYVRNRLDRLIAFSFIVNNYHGSISAINKIHKDLIIKLAELK